MAEKPIDLKKNMAVVIKSKARKKKDLKTRYKAAAIGTGIGALAGAALSGGRIRVGKVAGKLKFGGSKPGVQGTLGVGSLGALGGAMAGNIKVKRRVRKDLKTGNYKKAGSFAELLNKKVKVAKLESNIISRNQSLVNLQEMDRYKLKLEKTEKRRIRQIPVKSKSGRELGDRERKWAGKTGYAGGVGMGAVVGSHLSGRAKNLFVGKNAVRALRLRKALGRGTGAVGGAALGSAIGIGAGVKLGGVAGRLSDKMKKKKVRESSIGTFLDRKDQIRLFEALILRRQALANLLEAGIGYQNVARMRRVLNGRVNRTWALKSARSRGERALSKTKSANLSLMGRYRRNRIAKMTDGLAMKQVDNSKKLARIKRKTGLFEAQEAKRDDKKGIVSRRAKKGALAGALAGGSYAAGEWGIAKHALKGSLDNVARTGGVSGKALNRTVGGLHIGAKGARGALVGAGIGAGAGLIGKYRRRKKK